MPYTQEEMHSYGYHWDQIVPLFWMEAYSYLHAAPEHARHLFLLHQDGTESPFRDYAELDRHRGMFGVEKTTYQRYATDLINRKHLQFLDERNDLTELALKTQTGFFTLQTELEGFRYAFYDKDFLLVDQGIQPYGFSLDQSVNRILCEHFLDLEQCSFIDFDHLMESVQERFGSKPLDMVHVELKRDSWQLPETRINSSTEAIHAMQNLIKDMDREMFVVLNLSTKNQVINASVCSVGTMNAALVSPGEVFRTAICSGAKSIIALHNHPSGDPKPSKEDNVVTERLAQAGNLLGIQLLDHIVVGGDELYSYQEELPWMLQRGSDFSDELATAESADYVSRKEKVAQITENLKQAVKDFCSGEKYAEYLTTVAKFHNYSFNNCLLIAMQRPGASMVAGYNSWNSKFGRHVLKGEKGIQILSPMWKEIEDEQTGLKERKIIGYKPAYVFDVTQTEGKELPSLTNDLKGAVIAFDMQKALLMEIASVPVEFAETDSTEVHGYYSLTEKKIVIRPDMSEAQTLKTMIHEIAHSEMHVPGSEKQTRESQEVEAESVAFTVCNYFGLDSSEYSFGYISGWSSGKEITELQESLRKITDVASDLIDRLESAAEKKGLIKSKWTDMEKGEEQKHEKTVRKTRSNCLTA